MFHLSLTWLYTPQLPLSVSSSENCYLDWPFLNFPAASGEKLTLLWHLNSIETVWVTGETQKKTKRASLVFLNDGMRMCEVIVHIWIWSKSAYLHYFAFAYNPVHKYTSVHVAAVCFIRPPCFSYHVLMISTWSNFSATCITLSMWHTISRQLTWARECQPIGCAITPLSDISIITPPVVTLKQMKSVSKLESLFFSCVCCFSFLQCPCLSNNVNIQSPPPI